MNNNQVNESQNRDFTVGAGYRFKEVPLTIRAGGNKKQIKNDLNIRFDASLRKNITIIRFLTIDPETDEATNVTTGGRKVTLGFTADYMFSETFNILFFIDREVNKPFTTTSYDNSETNIGFNLRLSL